MESTVASLALLERRFRELEEMRQQDKKAAAQKLQDLEVMVQRLSDDIAADKAERQEAVDPKDWVAVAALNDAARPQDMGSTDALSALTDGRSSESEEVGQEENGAGATLLQALVASVQKLSNDIAAEKAERQEAVG